METKTNEELFKMIEEEKKGIIKTKPQLNKKYGCLEMLRYQEFGFRVGLGKYKIISFSGNCNKWSNAFNCKPERFKEVWEIINYFDNISPDQQKKINQLLQKYPNKLFITKDRDNFKIKWYYFPEEHHLKYQKIKYKDCSELKEVLNDS